MGQLKIRFSEQIDTPDLQFLYLIQSSTPDDVPIMIWTKNIARQHEREKGKEIKSYQNVYFIAMGEGEFYIRKQRKW